MLSKEFIKDLFDDDIKLDNNYTISDIKLLFYIEFCHIATNSTHNYRKLKALSLISNNVRNLLIKRGYTFNKLLKLFNYEYIFKILNNFSDSIDLLDIFYNSFNDIKLYDIVMSSTKSKEYIFSSKNKFYAYGISILNNDDNYYSRFTVRTLNASDQHDHLLSDYEIDFYYGDKILNVNESVCSVQHIDMLWLATAHKHYTRFNYSQYRLDSNFDTTQSNIDKIHKLFQTKNTLFNTTFNKI